MSKTWNKLRQESLELAKNLYDILVMKGEHISEENCNKIEELSKMQQPTVSVDVCDYCSTPLTEIENKNIKWCSECGNLYK